MTLPNKLTSARILLTPVFCLFFYLLNTADVKDVVRYVFSITTFLLYVIMEATDALDGHIARKSGAITDLGKIFDPFSDCFMHLSFFVLFVVFKYMSLVALLVILWRELLINFVRMLLSGVSVALPANIFGKFKTIFYAFLSFCVIAFSCIEVFITLDSNLKTTIVNIFQVLSYFAAFFSISSFIVYLIQIKKSGVLKSITK